MFLVIDNYDSFVHNLARYVTLAGADEVRIVRNDKITIAEIEALAPEAIILSPGPCTPQEAGICLEVIKHFGASIPILGVCLGHQAIGEAFGGTIVRGAPTHGKDCITTHNNGGIFSGIPSPFRAGRYHSLIVELTEDSPLAITARTTDDTIMALQHKDFPIYGVQFHPESVLTEHGLDIVKNFVSLAQNATQKEAA